MHRMILALLLMTTLAFAEAPEDLDYSNPETGDGSWPGPSKDERFCSGAFATATKSSAADLQRCAAFFATTHRGGVWVWKLTRDQIAAVGKRIAACRPCGDDGTRAAEALDDARKRHQDLLDPGTGESMEPILAKLLAGKPITRAEIRLASPLALWRYRNAAYARHGHAFKSPELQAFYYAPRGAGGMATSKLLPLSPNPAFKESMLDKVDTANTALVVGEIKRKKAE